MLVTEQSNHAAVICGCDLNDVPGSMLPQLSASTFISRYQNKIAPVKVAVYDYNHARTYRILQ